MKKHIKRKIDTLIDELNKLNDLFNSQLCILSGYIQGAFDSGGMTKDEYRDINELIMQAEEKYHQKLLADIEAEIAESRDFLSKLD